MTTTTRRRLTDQEMQDILDGCAKAVTPGEVLSAVVIKTFEALSETAWGELPEKVDPRDYALPQDQWSELCQALIDRGHKTADPLEGVNLGLDWVNIGPSAYEEDA